MKRMIVLTSLFLIAAACAHAQIATLEATLELRTVDGVTVPHQNGIPVPAFEKQQRAMIPLAGPWRKERFAANDALTLSSRSTAMPALLNEARGRETRNFDDSAWPVMTLPAVENQMMSYEAQPEFYEEGVWYRRTFDVPDSLRGRYVKLIFYAVNYVADVWINGLYLGWHEGGYTPFAFDVTSELDYGAANTIAIRVDNPAWGTRKDIVPFYEVDWFNYTGVIHDLYLEAADPLHVVRSEVVPVSTDGEILVRTVVGNQGEAAGEADVQIEIFRADVTAANQMSEQAADLTGAAAAFSGSPQQTLTIPGYSSRVWQTTLQIADPALWTTKTPNLYILRATVRRSGAIVDRFHTQFGIRTVVVDGNKVRFNHKPAFFTGVARHEDHPQYGRSLPVEEIFKDLQGIKKKINCQFLRTGHYPNHLATYLYADRLGLTVMEEIPVWWYDDPEPWLIQNDQRHIHEQMWREMIFRDYNRPSIILWSTCNECRDVDNRKIFIERVHNELDTLYPDGRLVSQSAAADRPSTRYPGTDASQRVCDVMGWTMYFGIFHGGTLGPGTSTFLDSVASQLPGKPAICTEYGYWSTPTGSSETFQEKVMRETFTALEARGAVSALGAVRPGGMLMAATWWCVYDWYSSSQGAQGVKEFQTMGLFHMDRTATKQVTKTLIQRYLPYTIHNGMTVGVEVEPGPAALPERMRLAANYPNPFNSRTVIRYELPQSAEVRLDILNLRGEVVETLATGRQQAGSHEAVWQSRHHASGLYLVRLQAAGENRIQKMTLLK